jgi:hypothetical protein
MSTPSPLSLVVRTQWQVDQALRDIGLTREIVRSVAFAAAGGRADSLAVDPRGAPGTLSYIMGVRTKRLKLLPLGWRESREGHVESTVNHELGIQVCFQNVDLACADRDPQAISSKGSASRDLVKSGQLDLWEGTDNNAVQVGRVPTVWLICVSVNGETVRAEVSCPKTFEGDQFEGFVRRLFVVYESFEPRPTRLDDSNDGELQFDVPVSKK